jgi:hypothetical protein
MINEENLELFRREVTENADKIDPYDDNDWHSLVLGWAIAKGMSPEEARKFANYVSYETDLA